MSQDAPQLVHVSAGCGGQPFPLGLAALPRWLPQNAAQVVGLEEVRLREPFDERFAALARNGPDLERERGPLGCWQCGLAAGHRSVFAGRGREN